MAATSEAEEDAVTGLGTKVGAVGLRGRRVVKSMTVTGTGEWTATGVSMGCSWENGIGESAMALAGYVTVLMGKTPDSAVMTTRAGKYH
jgi:hypothetical protein